MSNIINEKMKSSTGYILYHDTFSAAMQHAYKEVESRGYVVDPDDIDSKVATGPRKPSSGKTNSYILKTNNPRRYAHIQVYNTGRKYELNMYVEDFEDGELVEALSTAERRKKSRQIKRYAHRIKRGRKLRSKRMADSTRITKRAQKKAINLMRQRSAGSKGKNYSDLSFSERERIDKRVSRQKKRTASVARRMIPKVRKAERTRLSNARKS